MANIATNLAILAAAMFSAVVFTTPASAQNEQFVPILSYRTGPYAVNGAPYANGVADYYNLINERDLSSRMIEKLPELATNMPEIGELKVLQLSNGDGAFDALPAFLAKMLAIADSMGIRLAKNGSEETS